MAKFNIPTKSIPTPEQAYANILGQNEENQIVELSPDLLIEVDNQPFHIREEKIADIAESIENTGQLEPVIAVPSDKIPGKYILLAGRHRKRACELAGLPVKTIIKKNIDADLQRYILLTTNTDRNNDYLPSEKAFAYLEQQELLRKKGKVTNADIARENGVTTKEVQRYIRLTHLIKPLLDRVDKKEIPFIAGVDISFLSKQEQSRLFEFMLNHTDAKITTSIAKEIKQRPDELDDIFYGNRFVSEDNLSSDVENDFESNEEENSEDNLSPDFKSSKKDSKKVAVPDEATADVLSFILLGCTVDIKCFIADFYSTSEAVSLFKVIGKGRFYANSRVDDKCPIVQYRNKSYTYMFGASSILFKLDNREYDITYTALDGFIRQYIRKYVSKAEIIKLYSEVSNENN